MPNLYLPADHTDADLVFAGALAERLESTELYVTWTESAGQAASEVVAVYALQGAYQGRACRVG